LNPSRLHWLDGVIVKRTSALAEFQSPR